MQTYSHFIITWALDRSFKNHPKKANDLLPPVRTSALLWGSLAPDLILIVVGVSFIIYDTLSGTFDIQDEVLRAQQSLTIRLFDDWFFNNPWMIAGHHLFASPLLDVIYLGLGYWLWRRGHAWAGWLFWFACACVLHTLIDIPLHYDDGPLLLFPLNWEWRFYSPISYWDPARYGTEFTIFEHTFILGLLGYIVYTYRQTIGQWIRKQFGHS